MELFNKLFKRHSSDFKALQKTFQNTVLKFDLEEWELKHMTPHMCAKYFHYFEKQLGIWLSHGTSLINSPLYCSPRHRGLLDKDLTYSPSTRELMRPLELLTNYEKFYTEINKHPITQYVSACTNLINHSFSEKTSEKEILNEIWHVYDVLLDLFKDEDFFAKLKEHKQAIAINDWFNRSISPYAYGLCSVVEELSISEEIKEVLEDHISKYCDRSQYFNDVDGFALQADIIKGINFEKCIKACETRLELITLMLDDLNKE